MSPRTLEQVNDLGGTNQSQLMSPRTPEQVDDSGGTNQSSRTLEQVDDLEPVEQFF